jgi:hypothetical protein
MSKFFDILTERARRIDSLLCVGLDPEPDALGADECNKNGLIDYCKRIIDPTSDLTLIYKPNSAFFERFVCVQIFVFTDSFFREVKEWRPSRKLLSIFTHVRGVL